MNIAQSIAIRETGFNYIYGYDTRLLHLKCYHEDVYQGVAPNPDAIDYNPKPPVFACKFSTAPGYEHVIALANEDGKIALQNTAVNGPQDPLEGTQAHNNAIFDIAWMPQELKLITASSERTASLWDVSSDIKELQVFRGHTHSVKSAVFRNEDKAVFATGARDGAIMIWDIRASHNGQPKPDNSIFNAHKIKIQNGTRQRRTPSQPAKHGSISHSVTALAFQDDYTLLSCSAGDGLIKAWDLRKNYSTHKKEPIAKHIMNYGGKSNTYNGFTSLLVCPAGITLYASSVDQKIYAYNISSYNPNPIAEYYGHGSDDRALSFFVKACLSPDGEYIASGSNDETAYIWRTRNPGIPIIKLSGHRDEVTCIAWCNIGETKIVTCSDDCYHRIWRVRPEPIDEDNQTNIFGHAERYERLANVSPISSTPRSMFRTSYYTDSSGGSSKRSRLSSDFWSSEKKNKSILSPISENSEPSPKRACFGIGTPRAARKLQFGPSAQPELKSPKKTKTDDTIPSSSQTILFSPTTGLPNFVVDGTAPHLLANSPQKSKKQVIDWLTKIRQEKCAELNIKDKIKENSPSLRNRKTPSRRMSRSKLFRKTPKNSPSLSRTITNFYDNLNSENANVQLKEMKSQ